MNEYYFLFALVLVYALFAVVQDLKKKEVANWLNLSLIAFALAYRALYSLYIKDMNFFVFGLVGLIVFYIVGSIFYYSKAFGGGDVKLLAGVGVILPFKSYSGVLFVLLEFLIILFFIGAVYTLIYSIVLAFKNRKIFKKEFSLLFKRYWRFLLIIATFAILLGFFIGVFNSGGLGVGVAVFFVLISILYVYLKALDKGMIIKIKPDKLTEGDWILQDIKLNGYIVKNTVHGLTLKDIQMLRKAKKEVYVKTGIPFVPAVFFALLVMVFFSLVLKSDLLILLFSRF
ncbi:prepilin peptidase [Candidatus Pacearchaeota archaeon]|nr:prepilin peptidase [Candidatus Pacearchaeota archaeon]